MREPVKRYTVRIPISLWRRSETHDKRRIAAAARECLSQEQKFEAVFQRTDDPEVQDRMDAVHTAAVDLLRQAAEAMDAEPLDADRVIRLVREAQMRMTTTDGTVN